MLELKHKLDNSNSWGQLKKVSTFVQYIYLLTFPDSIGLFMITKHFKTRFSVENLTIKI